MVDLKGIKFNFVMLVFWIVFLFYFSLALLFSSMLLFIGMGDAILTKITELGIQTSLFDARLIAAGLLFWVIIFPVIVSVFLTMKLGLEKTLINLQVEVHKRKKE